MALARRDFLRMATATCACCAAASRVGATPSGGAAATATEHPHWSYAGTTGPEEWGNLQPDFKVCQLGLEQTPLNLTGSIKGEPGRVTLNYQSVPVRVVNNGHTIQANVEPGCSCTIDGTQYELLQFHFHHPSEHLLAGTAFDLECHFVHKANNGALAVIGVFIRPGLKNPDLAAVFDVMPQQAGADVQIPRTINPATLMPKAPGFFRYMGSLTTPPCSEGLTWTVYREPIEAAPEQIRQFAVLFANNARPVQNRNRRLLIESN